MCVMQTLLSGWDSLLLAETGTEGDRKKNVRDQGPATSLIITPSDCISSHLGLGRLWTHGILMVASFRVTRELHCLCRCHGQLRGESEAPFIVLNKNCSASVFISVSQCWKKKKEKAYDRKISVWKPKPAVAWMCQVQTSLCVLNEE